MKKQTVACFFFETSTSWGWSILGWVTFFEKIYKDYHQNGNYYQHHQEQNPDPFRHRFAIFRSNHQKPTALNPAVISATIIRQTTTVITNFIGIRPNTCNI
ncbi:hypothetical protein M1116_00110 [Patescibacteria group bacterium]|nr:hypothetical protein [Patescibacteria group bacterium]